MLLQSLMLSSLLALVASQELRKFNKNISKRLVEIREKIEENFVFKWKSC